MEPPRFPCPTCRRPVEIESYGCPRCGAPVALIWGERRQLGYFLRLAATFLLASLLVGVITVAVTDAVSMTAVGTRSLATISVAVLAAGGALWAVSGLLKAPPPVWETSWSAITESSRGRIEAPRKEK